jgi:hypothetical protein
MCHERGAESRNPKGPNIKVSNEFAIKFAGIAAIRATGAFNLVWSRTGVCRKKIKIIVAKEINAAVQIIALRGLLRQAKE